MKKRKNMNKMKKKKKRIRGGETKTRRMTRRRRILRKRWSRKQQGKLGRIPSSISAAFEAVSFIAALTSSSEATFPSTKSQS